MYLKFASIIADSKDEYPPYVTDLVYLGGCPLKCGYCYAPDLLSATTCGQKDIESLAAYFASKRAQAVSFKGGEPFSQANALTDLCKLLKGAGIRTKVETSGYFPESVMTALPWLDYLCVDLKAKLEEGEYKKATGVRGDLALVHLLRTLAFVECTPYPVFKEFRMTIVPGKNDSVEAVENAVSHVRNFCDLFVLQQFHPGENLVDPSFKDLPETPVKKLSELAMIARNLTPAVAVRTSEGLRFIR